MRTGYDHFGLLGRTDMRKKKSEKIQEHSKVFSEHLPWISKSFVEPFRSYFVGNKKSAVLISTFHFCPFSSKVKIKTLKKLKKLHRDFLKIYYKFLKVLLRCLEGIKRRIKISQLCQLAPVSDWWRTRWGKNLKKFKKLFWNFLKICYKFREVSLSVQKV